MVARQESRETAETLLALASLGALAAANANFARPSGAAYKFFLIPQQAFFSTIQVHAKVGIFRLFDRR